MSDTSVKERQKRDKRRDAGEATRDRLMAAAEILFAEHGFDGASTRALVQAAGADIAMIVYHFGSKQGLYREVLMRRARALNARRLAELELVLARARGRPDLNDVVRALVSTNIHLRSDPELGGLPVARLIARQLTDPTASARHMLADMFDDTAHRFLEAIRLALPDADEESVFWSYQFAISAIVQVMADSGRLEDLSGGMCDINDSQRVIDRLVPFIVGGIRGCVESAAARTPRRRAVRPAAATTPPKGKAPAPAAQRTPPAKTVKTAKSRSPSGSLPARARVRTTVP